MINTDTKVDQNFNPESIEARISVNRKKLGPKNDYVNLGMSNVSTVKKIAFVALKIFSVLTLVFAIPVFYFINKHLKNVANDTIRKDNLDRINLELPESDKLNEEGLKTLYENKLLEEGKYLEHDNLQSILDFLNPQEEEKKVEAEEPKPVNSKVEIDGKPAEKSVVDELNIEHDRLVKERTALQTKLRDLEGKKVAIDSELKSLKKEFDETKKVRDASPEKSKEKAEAHAKLVQMEKEGNEKVSQLKKCEAEIAKIEKSLAINAAKIKESEETIKDAKNQGSVPVVPPVVPPVAPPVVPQAKDFRSETPEKIAEQRKKIEKDLVEAKERVRKVTEQLSKTTSKELIAESKASQKAVADLEKTDEILRKKEEKEKLQKNLEREMNAKQKLKISESGKFGPLEDQRDSLKIEFDRLLNIKNAAKIAEDVAQEELEAAIEAYNKAKIDENVSKEEKAEKLTRMKTAVKNKSIKVRAYNAAVNNAVKVSVDLGVAEANLTSSAATIERLTREQLALQVQLERLKNEQLALQADFERLIDQELDSSSMTSVTEVVKKAGTVVGSKVASVAESTKGLAGSAAGSFSGMVGSGFNKVKSAARRVFDYFTWTV